jgi:hypothetical protein
MTVKTTDSERLGYPRRILPTMAAAPSPSNLPALSALAVIACVALQPVLASPVFPVPADRVPFPRRHLHSLASSHRPSRTGGLTSNSSWGASRSPLGLHGGSLDDPLTRGLGIYGGGSGGRLPGASAPFRNGHNVAMTNDDNSAAAARTDSLGAQLSEEISRCVGTSSSPNAPLSTRGGSTGTAPLPDEEQTSSAIVDTTAKSSTNKENADEPNNAAQYAKKLKVCSSVVVYICAAVSSLVPACEFPSSRFCDFVQLSAQIHHILYAFHSPINFHTSAHVP